MDISREEVITLANKLNAELTDLHRECMVQLRGGQDFSNLWAEAHGVFFAYRNVCQLLGWQ